MEASRDAVIWDAVTKSLAAIRDDRFQPIPLKNLSKFIANCVAPEECKNLSNHLAQLDVVKWEALKFIKGFQNGGVLSEKQLEELMERGRLNVAEMLEGNAAVIAPSVIDEKLRLAIRDLNSGADEKKSTAIQKLSEIFDNADLSADKWKDLVASVGKSVNNKSRNGKLIGECLVRAVRKQMRVDDKPKIMEVGNWIADQNTDSRPIGERIISFLWSNMLLPKSKRYCVAPLSGFMPGFFTITMEAVDLFLNTKPVYRSWKKNHKDLESKAAADMQTTGTKSLFDMGKNGVAYLHRFLADPFKTKSLKRKLLLDKIVSLPQIVTDGYQLHLAFIDLRRPTYGQQKFLEAGEENIAVTLPEMVDQSDETQLDNDGNGDDGDDVDGNGDDGDDDDGNGNGDDGNGDDGNGDGDDSCDTTGNQQRPGDYLSEISRYLAKTPTRAAQIKTIMAVDDGVRFPIDLTVISMPETGIINENSEGTRQRMRVRKGCLYQYETERASRLEFKKFDNGNILKVEAKLKTNGSKNSLSWSNFKAGYFSVWLDNHRMLFDFYADMSLRADRMKCCVSRQSLYDKLVDQIFKMLGVRYMDESARPTRPSKAEDPFGEYSNQMRKMRGQLNRDKLVVLGMQKISTEHKKSKPSKHAVFWKYFRRKIQPHGVDVVGLTEFRSSQACMWCCEKIKHDKKKHYRVYKCKECNRHAHRDDASSDIHTMIAWSEVIGVMQAFASGDLPKFDPDDTDSTVKYFRPLLFRPKWMRPKVSNEDMKDLLAKRSKNTLW